MFVTVILCHVASFGAAKWLLGDRWLVFGGCVLFGSVAALACGGGALYYTDRRFRSVRAVAEAARRGGAFTVIRGLAVALEGSCVVLIVVVLCGAGAYQLGVSTGVSDGGLLGLLLSLLGMTCSAPYVFAMDGMGAILDVSGVLSEATLGAQRPDVRARARLLHAVGTSAHAHAATLLTVTVTGGVLLLLASCLAIATELGALATTGLLASGITAVGAVLGALVSLAFVGLLFGRLLRASHVFAMGEASAEAASAAPVAEVDVASRTALRGMLAPIGLTIFAPICCAVALRIATSGDRVGSSAEALVALIAAATSVGALGSLLFTFSGSAWNNAKRHIEFGVQGRSDQHDTYAAAMVGEALGDAAKRAVSPSLQAAVMTLAALAAATLPFFL
jgi:K(+)-stimulated pyrophosphate-energized sodium pump